MLWLWYLAVWTDLVGLVPGARPEARLIAVERHAAQEAVQQAPQGMGATMGATKSRSR